MRLSVIIPAYNATGTLAETLQSAIAQIVPIDDPRFPRGGVWPEGPSMIERLCRSLGYTGEAQLMGPILDPARSSLEVMVVDDGSKDGTAEFARTLAAHCPEEVTIRVLTKANGGPASARNAGIRQARGELVAFLDADDLWVPRKLKLQVERLRRDTKAGMCFSDAFYFRQSGIYEPPGLNAQQRRGGDIFERLLTVQNFIPQLTVTARRSALDAVSADRGKMDPFDESPEIISSEDLDLWLNISARSPVAYVRERLAWYRVHPGGLNWSRINRSHEALRHVVERMAEHPRAADIPRDAITSRLASSWYEQGYEHAEAGQGLLALQCHARSMRMRPTLRAAKGLARAAAMSLPGVHVKPRTVTDRGQDDVSFDG